MITLKEFRLAVTISAYLAICTLSGAMSLNASAQQIPVRSNYLMSTLMDHPAAAGNRECVDMRLGNRNQWVGMPGGPTNSFISITGRVSEDDNVAQGFAGRVETDQAGAWGTTSFSLAYSHKIQLRHSRWLSAGFALGVTQHRLNTADLEFPEFSTSSDPAVLGSTQFLFPTVDAGIWYQDRKNFGGITLINATSASLSEIALNTTSTRHVVITAGSSMELEGKFMFRPSTNIRFAGGLPPSFEINGSVVYDDAVAVGLGYRSQSEVVGQVQFAVMDYVKIGYSYGFGISAIRTVAPNSHEITLALSSCNTGPSRGVKCSAYD